MQPNIEVRFEKATRGLQPQDQRAIMDLRASLIYDHRKYPDEWLPLVERGADLLRESRGRGIKGTATLGYAEDKRNLPDLGKNVIFLPNNYSDAVFAVFKK